MYDHVKHCILSVENIHLDRCIMYNNTHILLNRSYNSTSTLSSCCLSTASAIRSSHFASLQSFVSQNSLNPSMDARPPSSSSISTKAQSEENLPNTSSSDLHPHSLPCLILILTTSNLLPPNCFDSRREHMRTDQSIGLISPSQTRLDWLVQVDALQPDRDQGSVQARGQLEG